MNNNNVEIKNEELKLVSKELFEGIEIECYEDAQGNFRITRRQISEALQYKDTSSFHKVIQRNRDVIGESWVVKMSIRDKDGRNVTREFETYTFNQLFQILRFSKQPLANSFMNWASLTVEQLIMKKAELKFHNTSDMFQYKQDVNEIVGNYMKEVNDKMNSLMQENKEIKNNLINMQNSLIFKQYENPKHRFEASITKFAIHNDYNGSQRYYQLYRGLENWLGVTLPSNKNYTTKEYILSEIGIEIVECFVDGVISGRIVKSDKGNYVDLNGVFANPVEWEKVKNEFDNKCAYCHNEGVLIAEHIVPQSTNGTSDLIHNIVPACSCCNESKNNENVKTWFPKQEFYSDERILKVARHFKNYKVSE